jgi:Protein of unknown function (DUF455)
MNTVSIRQSSSRPRRIGGSLSVAIVAQRLRHYAYLELRLMEAQASWLPYFPQPELKIELGYHIYDDACHVDELRRRLPEVGAFDQALTPANERMVTLLNELTNTEDVIERLAGLYLVLRPQLAALYRAHLEQDDSVANNPTVRILERLVEHHERLTTWGVELLRDLAEPDEWARAEAWRDHLLSVMSWAGGLTGEAALGEVAPSLHDAGPGKRLRKDPPVRDSRFRVMSYVRKEGRAATDVWDHETFLKYLFMNVIGEIEATESCARTLYDYPEVPWELRFSIARQMWDEARHAELSMQRFAEIGGRLDLLPVRDTFPLYFGPIKNDDLCFRLAHLNQVVEGWVTDDFAMMIPIAQALGDDRSARLFEYLIADEWSHIKIGADWIPRLTAGDPEYRQRVIAYRQHAEATLHGELDFAAVEAAEQRQQKLGVRTQQSANTSQQAAVNP